MKAPPQAEIALGVCAGGTQARQGARYREIARRRGKNKACAALGNTQLRVYHKRLSNPGMRYHDLGPDYYQRQAAARRKIAYHGREIEPAHKWPRSAATVLGRASGTPGLLDIFITFRSPDLASLTLPSDTQDMDTTVVPHRTTLRSGHRVLVRALRRDDAPGLAEGFEQLSETSRYRRFFTAKPHLSEQSLAFLTAVDHRDHEALVAVAPGSGQLVGVARFIRHPREPDQAEVAITVTDSWQRRGLGTALLRELAQRAAEEGIRYFTAEILAENQPMLTLAHRLGHAETTPSGSTVSARIDLTAATEQAGASSYDGDDLLRAAARGEFIGLPSVLPGWLDLSEKIIATLLVPVSDFCDTSQQAAPTATALGRLEEPG